MTMQHDVLLSFMRRTLVLAAPFALVACATAPAPRPRGEVPAGTVSVTYGDPSQFSDARSGGHESEAARRAWLDALCGHLAERAAVALPAGQRLAVQLTDVQRAGAFESWRGPQAAHVRIVRDLYPPRIDLRFQRLAADGRVLQSESRQLRDPAFLTRPAPNPDDPLRFEKRLVDDWVAREFGGAR